MGANRTSGPGFLAGFLIGALIGAAIGLLLAPKPGRESRLALKARSGSLPDQFEDLKATAQEAAADIASFGKEFVDTTKRQFEDAVERGKEAAAETRAELEREFGIRNGEGAQDAGTP